MTIYRQLERAEEEVPLVISCKPKGKLGGKFFGDPSYFAHVVVCEALVFLPFAFILICFL